MSTKTSRRCVDGAATCKVDDGGNLNVAVKGVNARVKVKENDNVNSIAGQARRFAACCSTFEAIAPSKATQVTFARPRTRN